MFFEPLINSPPLYLLDNPAPADQLNPGTTNRSWPAALDASLGWLAHIQFSSAGSLSFSIVPAAAVASPSASGTQIGRAHDDWEHLSAGAAQGAAASQMLPALLPDLTTAFGRADGGLPVRLVERETTACSRNVTAAGAVGPSLRIGRAAVAVAGFRQAWDTNSAEAAEAAEAAETAFCGWVVAVNLCETPTAFALEVDGVPAHVTEVYHQFGAYYGVALDEAAGVAAGATAGATAARRIGGLVVDGYSTAVLRIGCDGFREQGAR